MPKFPTTRASLIIGIGDANNDQAWGDFVDLYQPVIYRLARERGLQHSDAEDVTQEMLVKVSKMASSQSFDKTCGSLRGWLGVTLRNLVIQRFGRKGVIAKATEPVGDPNCSLIGKLQDARPGVEEFIENEAQLEAFRVAEKRVRREFSEATWQAFWQTWIDQKPVHEVAQRLGITSGAVYIARSRVMRRLREEASTLYGGEE